MCMFMYLWCIKLSISCCFSEYLQRLLKHLKKPEWVYIITRTKLFNLYKYHVLFSIIEWQKTIISSELTSLFFPEHSMQLKWHIGPNYWMRICNSLSFELTEIGGEGSNRRGPEIKWYLTVLHEGFVSGQRPTLQESEGTGRLWERQQSLRKSPPKEQRSCTGKGLFS